MPKNILITGSSGFLGNALKNFLKEKNVNVLEFDVRANKSDDVRDFSRITKSLKHADGIIHTASVSRPRHVFEKPLESVDINLKGTINILEASKILKKHPWFIFISSREVFGDNPRHPVKEDSPRVSKDLYVVCKIACEELCRVYSGHHGIRTRVLRFSNLYTDRNDYLDRVIPRFITKAALDEDIGIDGKGKELFDFVYIKDAVRAIWACMKDIESSKKPFDDFNIGSGSKVTLTEAAEIVIQKLKSKSKVFKNNRNVSVSDFVGDYSKAEKILGYKPMFKFEKGIDFAIKEFKNAKLIE
jgi:nucleoside-diphosphate-sugar epimerase